MLTIDGVTNFMGCHVIDQGPNGVYALLQDKQAGLRRRSLRSAREKTSSVVHTDLLCREVAVRMLAESKMLIQRVNEPGLGVTRTTRRDGDMMGLPTLSACRIPDGKFHKAAAVNFNSQGHESGPERSGNMDDETHQGEAKT